MSEKDIKIVTLADSKLQIFSPPSNISQTKTFIPLTPNLIRNPVDINNPDRTNFIFSSKIEYLGSGGFSKVYKYRGDIENKAVKKIIADPKYYSKTLTAVDSIKREVYGMTKIKCENSLKVYGVFQNEEKNTFFILMELCDGNIEKYIKDRGYPLNIDELLILLTQLNKAFHLLDTNNIIHRDIKPSNILYKEEKDSKAQKFKIKRLFGGSKLVFKLGDYGVCLPLYKENFSKSQFMGTMDFMAPEIYKMKTEKEHPTYTKKIDLFSLGQSILCLMGFIKKAEPLTVELVDDLKKKCDLFNGKKKEKLLADLIFNHLLIFEPEKRDDWDMYLKHPFFDQENFSYNYFENENKSYMDQNVDRIKKRIIVRNNKEANKNNESKKINSNIKKDRSKKSLDISKLSIKKKQGPPDKKEEKKDKEINLDKVNKKSNPNIINKNSTNTSVTLRRKGYLKSDNLNDKSPKTSHGNIGVKYNSNIKSELMLRKKKLFKNKDKISLLDNNNNKNSNKSIKKASTKNINLNKSNKSNKNILNERNKKIMINNLDSKRNNTNKTNKYFSTAEKDKIIPSNRYSTGKLNRTNMVNNNTNIPFDLRKFNIEKKKTFDYKKIKTLLSNNKTYDNNNYIMSQRNTNNVNLDYTNGISGHNNRKASYMDGKIKIINLYDTINNYDNNNLIKSTSNYNTNMSHFNFDSIRNRYKFINFLQKQRNRNSEDISDASFSQDNSIKKQKSVMVNSRYENKNYNNNNNDIKKSSTIRFMDYNNNFKNYKSNYNSYYNNHIINKSINLSQVQTSHNKSINKSINKTFHDNNQKKNIKQQIEAKKPKCICIDELKDKKLKCICGCEDNIYNIKFNHSPDFKFHPIDKNIGYNNINIADNINVNRSAINYKREKYNNFKNNIKEKNSNYINIKSIELKEGLKRNKNTEFYYSKYSKTKNAN